MQELPEQKHSSLFVCCWFFLHPAVLQVWAGGRCLHETWLCWDHEREQLCEEAAVEEQEEEDECLVTLTANELKMNPIRGSSLSQNLPFVSIFMRRLNGSHNPLGCNHSTHPFLKIQALIHFLLLWFFFIFSQLLLHSASTLLARLIISSFGATGLMCQILLLRNERICFF